MINFRFYALALAAVFAALTIGLVLGTAVANGPVTDSLKDQTTALSKNLSNQRDENRQLLEEINRDQSFAKEIAPAVLGGKLTGRKLVVVALPGSSDYADGVVAMLTVAGATVTAQLTMRDKFFDPAAAYELLDLAHQSPQPTVRIDGLPGDLDAVETASAQLTLALLQRPDTQAAPGDVTAILSTYAKAGYLTVSDTATGGADGTVMVSGEPASDKNAAKRNQSAVTVSAQFSKDKPLVVAGSGAGDGNLISAVRRNPKLVERISTVDNANLSKGQVVTALVTAERMLQGKVGQYGHAAGATSELPKVAA